ncbi:competence protein [Staphylococcus marylandisciuri]|nr:competence protein [Staphylococcus marylandisciuri]
MLIISILLYIQAPSSKINYQFNKSDHKNIAQLITHFNLYKSLAIKKKHSIVLYFHKGANRIKVKEEGNKKEDYIFLSKGFIDNRSNLNYINFDKKGHINQFGSLYININSNVYRIIFHIEKGRIRFEKA